MLAFAMVVTTSLSDFYFYDDSVENMSFTQGTPAATDSLQEDTMLSILPILICSAAAGGLGIAGGVMVRKKNIASGVLFLVAAAASYFNFPSLVCFILAGIFAFVKEKPKPIFYPYYPYPPVYPYYPPYGAPQGYPPAGNPQGQYPQTTYGQPPYGYPQPPYIQPPYGQSPYYPQQQPVVPPVQNPAGPQGAPTPNAPSADTQDSGDGQPQS
jgi:hypothetical protein